MNSRKLSLCANCMALGFDKALKRCAGCGVVDYCSREYVVPSVVSFVVVMCGRPDFAGSASFPLKRRRADVLMFSSRCQKQAWKKHKFFCHLIQGKGRKDAYLSGLSPEVAQRVMVDAYRLRVEIDHHDGDCDHGIYYDAANKKDRFPEGVVWAKGDVYDDFQTWLDLAEDSGVLPDWWGWEERMECLAMGVDRSGEENVFTAVDQTELIKRYEGDTSVRVAMLVLAELVVGYEGKGRAESDDWYMRFSEHLDLHPEERARLIKGSVEAVRRAFEEQGLGEKVKEGEGGGSG